MAVAWVKPIDIVGIWSTAAVYMNLMMIKLEKEEKKHALYAVDDIVYLLRHE